MRLTPAVRVRIAAAVSALTVLASVAAVRAQFTPPTCVPPLCNPEVIQNIDVDTGTAQVADINITGDSSIGAKFEAGQQSPTFAAATDYLFFGNVNAGSTAGYLLALQTGGADRFKVNIAGQLQAPLGSAAAPSYSFLTDTNTGFFSSAADSMSFVTNGVARTIINNNGTTVNSGVLTVPAGTAAAPSITFAGDTNTGIYRSAADTFNITTNGVSRFQIDSTGAVLIPGSLTVQGTFTASGGVGGDGSALTNLNASNITTGTLNDARLSTNVALYNGTGTFTGANTFSNAGNSFTGSGAGLTSLNASNVSSGTLNDARLSSNVALLDRLVQTFTGNNTFSGMTSLGSAALVAGAGQNMLYGVADSTSAGNLMLLQSENAGVYTDRFRVAMDGAVTAGSFSGVGTNLTALNATQLTSGTVPSARLSGTYSNNLTFSGMTTFGSATRVVSAGQNLVYGNIDATSAGNLLLLQNESVDRFRVDAAGNLTLSGTITASGSLTSGGVSVCLQNGTNCPSALGGGGTGSGTDGYISRFTGASSLGDSVIYQDAANNIGIGTTTPTAKLYVSGAIGSNDSVSVYTTTASAAISGQALAVGSTGVVGSGNSYGVYGVTGAFGYGVYGYNTAAGASGAGVYGYHSGTGPGVQGSSAAGWGGSFSSLYVTPGTAYFASAVTLNGGATVANAPLTLASLGADPAGANGAMYYSTGSNAFRCYASGAWGNCGVGGSGTANYVPRFTPTGSALGNSTIQDNGSTASVGGNPPSAGVALAVGPTNLGNAFIATTNAASGVGIYGFGLGSSSIGVYGQGQGSGVSGVGGGASGVGLQGTGNYAGVTGTTANVWGYGVLGTVPSGSYAYGVYGITGSSQYSSAGVAGINSGNGMGGYFQSNNGTTYALLAYNGSGGYAFQAQGTSNFTGAVSMNNSLGVAGGTNLAGSVVIGDASSDVFIINSAAATIPNGLNFDLNTLYIDAANNRVGLGTASPARQMTVFNSTDPVIQLTNTASGAAAGDGLLLIQSGLNAYVENGEAGNLTLRTSAADRVTVSSGGNVGIGTTAPYEKFEVDGGDALFYGTIGVGGVGPWTNYGVVSQASESAGHFFNSLYPSVYGSFGFASAGDRYGVYGSAIDSTGTVKYAGYFNAGGSGTNYGVYANGSSYGVYGNGTSYGVYGNGSSYGLYGNGSSYGVRGYASSYGGLFSNPTSSVYLGGTSYGVYVGGSPTYGVYAYGNSTAGRFYDYDGTATTFIAGASYGVEIITGNAIKPGGGAWLASSDRRVKKDIYDFKDGLDVIRGLRPVNFTYNGLGGTTEGLKSIGLVAQEAQEVAPYLIMTDHKKLREEDAEETDILLVDPSAIPFINTNAIKELDFKIVGLEARVEKLDEVDARVKALEERLEELEAELEALKER